MPYDSLCFKHYKNTVYETDTIYNWHKGKQRKPELTLYVPCAPIPYYIRILY